MKAITDSEGLAIEPGTRVIVMSNWPGAIPLGHVYTGATVQRITRAGKLVLSHDTDAYGERRVWPSQVSVRKAQQ